MNELPYRSILFICEANKCRSAVAELLLKDMLRKQGLDGQIQVRSGGIAFYAWDGALMSHDMKILLKQEGIDSEDFRATDLKRHREWIAESDLLLTMTQDQLARLSEFPEAEGKEAHTLRGFVGEEGDILDPERQERDEAYEECKAEVHRCVGEALHRICPHLGSVSD